MASAYEQKVAYAREAWTQSESRSQAIEAHIKSLQRDVSTLQRHKIHDGDRLTSHIQHEHDRFRELARTRDAGHQDGPANAGSSSSMALGPYFHFPKELLMHWQNMKQTSRNGDDSHDSGSGERRQVSTTREYTYSDFLKCQPINFKGNEGIFSLTQWFNKMESVFHISNCTVACQIKFATCTLLGTALTWWNSHVKTVGHDAAYGIPRKTLKKMMTAKMFPKESDEVEKYVGGLPDTIQGSVMASKPKTMQDAIEFATKLMDEKICTITRETN
ncbi:hypothetical protein Tco_1412448 [Tanacetum coccineum]